MTSRRDIRAQRREKHRRKNIQNFDRYTLDLHPTAPMREDDEELRKRQPPTGRRRFPES